MSYGVVTGSPVAAQIYLDSVLDDILKNCRTRDGVDKREHVNLAEVMFHCMRTNPDRIQTINGASDKKFTNAQILKRAVSLARAVRAISATKTTVILMLRNHEHMSALYYAMFLAGVVPFMMEPSSTEYEIQHFVSLVTPRVVFCEPERRDDVSKVVCQCDITVDVVVADGPSLDKFVEGFSDDVDSFKLPDVDPEATAMLLPTSGSTGLPKAAKLTYRGLTLQMPTLWLYHSQFPQPTGLILLLSTSQWMTHTMIMTSSVAFGVPVLISPKNITPEYVVELIDKYQPTWTILGPALASSVGQLATSSQLSSLEMLVLGGSPFTEESVAQLKGKLSNNTVLINAYGLTEMQGIVATGNRATPLTSIGNVFNLMEYKLVNDNDEEVLEVNAKGELYLKSKCILKGYVNNEEAYHDTVTADGWLKTGDVFYRNEQGHLFFVNRTKLGFKYMNHHIYPEEIESVIGSVPGVQQCVVCGADAGPAVAVVLRPGCDVTRDQIHHAVNSKLSDHKRLRGGIAFVEALPRTHNGKINRNKCLQLVKDLISTGECF
ncbi:uncharacterized protein isoform X2 [Choristoneura fumiferana]|uniref:uncharacterized protein isoform X2 n=1 Tax=Choristoneura fumiferana TaxID=7141 RepID=UPI003D154607